VGGDTDYSQVRINNDDIIPIIDSQKYNITIRNEIDMTFKIFASNSGTKDSGVILIQLYIKENGITHFLTSGDTGIIKKDKTRPFYINTTIPSGEYDFEFLIWENGKVIDKETVTILISLGSTEEISIIKNDWRYY